MHILFKFIYNNLKEKKVRTFLVMISVIVSSALFFASLCLSETTKEMYLGYVKQWAGNADISIEPRKETGLSRFIDETGLNDIQEQLNYVVHVNQTEALYAPDVENMLYMDIVGIDFDNLKTYNPIQLEQSEKLVTFEGNNIIISTTFAKKNNLSIGSKIQLEFSTGKSEFIVVGISKPKGMFLSETKGYIAILPKDTVDIITNSQGSSSKFYLQLKNNKELEQTIKLLSEKYPDCEVKQAANPTYVAQAATTISMPFAISSMFVMFMSIFIIYTSFNLISLERLPAIGTFRSAGATKKKINSANILESLFLGLTSGVLGCVLGLGVLYIIIVGYVSKLSDGAEVAMKFSALQVIITLIFSTFLTILSALIPIIRTSKIPVKDIILNNLDTGKKRAVKGGFVLITLLILYIICLLVPNTMSTNLISFIITIVCMTAILIIMIIAVPYVVSFFANTLAKFNILGNTQWLGMKNVADNKSLLNIVKLLTVSITSIIVIMGISSSISDSIVSEYEKYHKYDISMSYRQADEKFSEELSSVDGVDTFVNNYEMDAVLIEKGDMKYYLNTLYGIQNEEFFNFIAAEQTNDSLKAIQNLGGGKNVVITELMASKLGLNIGDELVFELNGNKVPYTVTGFLNSSFKLGNIGYISADNLKEDANLEDYTNTYIKINKDRESVRNNIKNTFLENILFIQTWDELVESNQDSVMSILRIINAYVVLATVIGLIGVINSIMVSFMERKRALAMYRSVGMSQTQMKSMLLTESLTMGIFGAVFAFIGTLAMLKIAPVMLGFIFGETETIYNIKTYFVITVSTVIAMCLISFIPIMKSRKLSIIDSIKYE